MSKKILTDINMCGNQVIGATFEKSSSVPITTVVGTHYYNTTENKEYYFNGTNWVEVGGQGGSSDIKKITELNPELPTSGEVCVWTITNTTGSDNVFVSVKEIATNELVLTDVSVTMQTITITILSSTDIASGTYKATIIG